MSFAGPSDPRLREALLKANRKGIVLIAAVGNAGPNSPLLYPAADPNVIAVTATDARDTLFPGANRGSHIAVAAPGVDILVPAPDGGYQFTTGTSVAAAEVSGAAALLIERNPSLTPAEVRKILMDMPKTSARKARTAISAPASSMPFAPYPRSSAGNSGSRTANPSRSRTRLGVRPLLLSSVDARPRPTVLVPLACGFVQGGLYRMTPACRSCGLEIVNALHKPADIGAETR